MNNTTLFYILWNLHILLESLPISSSSHLEIINNLIARAKKQSSLTISKTTSYLMHIPTLFVVGTFLSMRGYQFILNNLMSLGTAMLFANSITFACSLGIKKIKIKGSLPLGLCITSLALLSLPAAPKGLISVPSLFDAIFIGLAQGISLLPGISRLAVTYAAGIWLALTPETSFLFSLFIEFFLVAGAIVLALYEQWQEKKEVFPHIHVGSVMFIVLSSCVAYFLLELVFSLALRGQIAYVGFYTLALALLLFSYKGLVRTRS